jgi:hypothetical protein
MMVHVDIIVSALDNVNFHDVLSLIQAERSEHRSRVCRPSRVKGHAGMGIVISLPVNGLFKIPPAAYYYSQVKQVLRQSRLKTQ